MFETLTALGIGLISFALIVGVGVIVLGRFAGSIADCSGNYSISGDGVSGNATVWNDTSYNCQFLDNGVTQNGSGYTPEGAGYTNVVYMNTQLGVTGLAGWVPAIIAFTIGMLFIGGILVLKGGRNY